MRVDEVPLPQGHSGRLFATGFSTVGPDPERALASVGGDVLVCLLTAAEIDLRFPAFGRWLTGQPAGRVVHFPTDDGGVGDDGEVVALVDHLGRRLDRGAAVVTHCGAGLGRTSVVCGLLLVRAGLSLADALVAVRAARPGAGPENPEQRAHLERVAAMVTAG